MTTLFQNSRKLFEKAGPAYESVKKIFTEIESQLRGFFEQLSRDPLYIVTTAYKANLYYTALESYDWVLAEYDDLILATDRFKKYDTVFERMTPVLISTSFSPIFDQHVQAIHGFVSLHQFCFAKKTHSTIIQDIVLAVDPSQFLRYLHIQSQRKIMESEVALDCVFPKGFDLLEPKCSQLVERVLISEVFFYAALRQSGAKILLRSIPTL